MGRIFIFLLLCYASLPAQDLLEIDDEFETLGPMAQLHAGRDALVTAAAFEFSQVFFRLRGYDNSFKTIMLNGFQMNKFQDGRPQWNNWGGLNDMTRNQDDIHGISENAVHFGGLAGMLTMDTGPSGLRPGLKAVVSSSNRTYANRIMATYISAPGAGGRSYALSASRRWAQSGYIEGTPYKAYSAMFSLEQQLGKYGKLLVTGIYADNRRGRSAPLTEEVAGLKGRRYNPYWGVQNGAIRNSRERRIEEPLLMINYRYSGPRLQLGMGYKFQWGNQSRSRLGYFNAPNPDPTYYRYLPGFYYNSSGGSDFAAAESARSGFLDHGQISWNTLYKVNSLNGTAFYLHTEDVLASKDREVFLRLSVDLNEAISLDFRIGNRTAENHYYGRINDLLGAKSFMDRDPFTGTFNDQNDIAPKRKGDKIGYHYQIASGDSSLFLQGRYDRDYWSAFLSGYVALRDYRRTGHFQNGRFPENSLGKGPGLAFKTFGIKAGLRRALYNRIRLEATALMSRVPPTIGNAFVNPRENNLLANGGSETRFGTGLGLYLNSPGVKGRVAGYYSRVMDVSDVNFYFTDTAMGSDFVQEVVTGMDFWHKGLELSLEYRVSSAVLLKVAASIGTFVYASNPELALYVDGFGDGGLMPSAGRIDAGLADVKGMRAATGPQHAYAVGISYNDPKYWWAGVSVNFLAHNYPQLALLQYTGLFWQDEETGEEALPILRKEVSRYLRQQPWPPVYLLNCTMGKSWKLGDTYLGVFTGVNNILDAKFRSGGFHQSRNGHYRQFREDHISPAPSFGLKSWYGLGRTYFLNLTCSFKL